DGPIALHNPGIWPLPAPVTRLHEVTRIRVAVAPALSERIQQRAAWAYWHGLFPNPPVGTPVGRCVARASQNWARTASGEVLGSAVVAVRFRSSARPVAW